MGAGRSLTAWSNKGRFAFVGGLELGTKVLHGRGKSFVVPAEVYAELLQRFAGQEVAIGASRRPPRDSLNAWLRKRLPDVELPVAYVGPILVGAGAAERDGDLLRFAPAAAPQS
ncbi:MAG TPA: hypothetical protein VNX21_02985 [Candidatus Thermoplasmatota archaeon]|nr:hypothetical protein [Candidatus Thermoplasmatota archaeon]